jgi:hypothetical protein
LNRLECGSVELEYASAGRNDGQANPATDKDVQYFKLAANGFFQEFWTLDREQSIGCQRVATNGFTNGNDAGVVLA